VNEISHLIVKYRAQPPVFPDFAVIVAGDARGTGSAAATSNELRVAEPPRRVHVQHDGWRGGQRDATAAGH
jgi:hypothetical protein